MNKDGNILLALSGKTATSSAISSLLLELDIHLSTNIEPIKSGFPTFGLGREDQEVIVSSFAVLEQG
jgi:hypothetical protein